MKHQLGAKWKRGQDKPKHTPIPLLALQMAVFSSYPTKRHKDALASLRASLADAAFRASTPKVRQRL